MSSDRDRPHAYVLVDASIENFKIELQELRQVYPTDNTIQLSEAVSCQYLKATAFVFRQSSAVCDMVSKICGRSSIKQRSHDRRNKKDQASTLDNFSFRR